MLGIDTGFAIAGWAILNNSTLEDYGVIKTKAGQPTGDRLQVLRQDFTELLMLMKPDQVEIEQPFSFGAKSKNETLVHQAFGVIVLTLAEQGYKAPLCFAPSQVKQAATGNGGADKDLVRVHLEGMYGELRGPDDGIDAIAVAICGLNEMEKAA